MFRSMLLIASLLVAGTASAQDVGTKVWLTGDVASLRFADEAVPGPKFTAGASATVVVNAGDLLRVDVDGRLGWVPALAVTATAPAAPELPPIELVPAE